MIRPGARGMPGASIETTLELWAFSLLSLRKGRGAKNMAVVRHFAISLIRAATDKKSIKLRRKLAGWDPEYLAGRLGETCR